MIEFIFVLSIAGNTWQWIVNERQAERIEHIKQVNKDNAITVNNFKASLTKCTDRIANWERKESDWEIERATSEQGINELASDVDSVNWGDCRSPVDLEF